MQDAADEDGGVFNSLKDHVFFVLDAPVSLSNSFTASAHFRRPRELMEDCFKAVEIAAVLVGTPGVDGVVGDFDEVEAGQL